MFSHPARRFTILVLIFPVAALLPYARGQEQAAASSPEKKPLTYDLIYGPKTLNFDAEIVRGLRWRPDGKHFAERKDDVLVEVDALTGEKGDPVYDVEKFEKALAANGDFDADAAKRFARRPTWMTPDEAAAVISHKGKLYVYRYADNSLKSADDEKEEAVKGRRELTLSPDAKHIAFRRDHNLYTRSLESGETRQLTKDGTETLLNGLLDWVYQEEVYGRGTWRAYWWSKDGKYIAYLQLDEKEVPIYPLVNYLSTHPSINNLRWPKAGDPNPKVRLGIVPAEGGQTVWVDLSKYEKDEPLVVTVDWAPDGRLVYQVQDREQTWLDLNDADPKTGKPRTLVHEAPEGQEGWIDREEHAPIWLKDKSFLWLDVRDGYRHIYHYARDGKLIKRVTEGPLEVRDVHGVDEARGMVYFSGIADSPVETHTYRAPLKGGKMERLTEPGFTHSVQIDPKFQYMVDTFSNVTTPPRVYLRKINGGEVVRKISENDVPVLKEYDVILPKVVRVPTDRGYGLNALLVLPPDWSPAKKYPVFCPVYSGPHAVMVTNSWKGHEAGYWTWLAQEGYIVWACDPYSASGEGAKSAWHAYQKLGVAELEDLETGVQYLIDKYSADPERIAIFGHSYGGFMVAYALTHGSKFTAGIAVAGVMDWKNYDSIYTERFMRTPAHNPDGYKAGSVVEGAKNLHGKLLIIHGAVDDNVHFQNSLQLIEALEDAGKSFELMVYPSNDHGAWRYYARGPLLGLDFLKRNFGTPSGQDGSSVATAPATRGRRGRRPRGEEPTTTTAPARRERATRGAFAWEPEE